MADGEKDTHYRLRSGEYLTAEQATLLTQSTPTSLVVVGGRARSGKTSLVSGIYALLQKGPLAELHFAGSQSLSGFEQRCHLATVGSGLLEADMERTIIDDEQRFLHLRFRNQIDLAVSDVLFSDISGEAFDDAADSSDDCKKLEILHRADNFAILLDGKRACDKKLRQQAFTVVEALISQCLDHDMLSNVSAVQLIVSKWDLVKRASQSQQDFLEEKLLRLEQSIGQRLGEFAVYRIAVRHWSNGKMNTGEDLQKLLTKWLRIRPVPRANSFEKTHSRFTEFDKFGEFATQLGGTVNE